MATRLDHTLLLDQLQEQVHLVLENTGRLFAAINADPKVAPVAQSHRLRSTFPGAVSRFNEALDQLEEELQLAKYVMRRDLAVWREKTGYQVPEALMKVEDDPMGETLSSEKEAADSLMVMSPTGAEPKANELVTPAPPAANEDLEMGGTHDGNSAAEADVPLVTSSASEPKSAATEPETTATVAEMTDATPSEPKNKATSADGLHLNTTQLSNEGSNQENSDDKPLDTADLDSLFNDPLSAGGPDAGNEANANNGEGSNKSFNFEENVTADFDLDSFSANLGTNATDDDDVSALMPGLRDYANSTPNNSGDFDFTALFGTMDGGTGQDGDQQEGEGQRDTTIDYMLNMAGDFDSGNAGDGDGHANDDLDFDSLFNS